jgi:hypothetical protein
MLKHFDTEAVISLLAPRPVLFMTGEEDPGSPLSGIHKIEGVVRKVYGLYHADSQFSNITYPHTGHVYTPEMWVNMVRWMKERL